MRDTSDFGFTCSDNFVELLFAFNKCVDKKGKCVGKKRKKKIKKRIS